MVQKRRVVHKWPPLDIQCDWKCVYKFAFILVNVRWQLIKQSMNGFTGVTLWNSAVILRVCLLEKNNLIGCRSPRIK